MSWAALPVGPACIGKTCGGKRGVRSCSLDWLDRQIIYKHIRRYECLNGTGWIIRYDPFNKEYSMDSEEDIRDWYMSYINEMRDKYGGK